MLTKADRVQDGDHVYWLDVLKNKLHPLHRGYFVTRLQGPSTKKGIQNWKDARDDEEKLLFNQPWCIADRRRLGTKRLSEALSEALEEMIKKRQIIFVFLQLISSLPHLMDIVQMQLIVVQENLNSLPQSFADNPQGKLLNLCSEFNSRIQQSTTGTGSHLTFLRSMQMEFLKLAKDINNTRPRIDIPVKTEEKKKTEKSAKFVGSFDAALVVPPPYASPSPASIEGSASTSDVDSDQRIEGISFLRV